MESVTDVIKLSMLEGYDPPFTSNDVVTTKTMRGLATGLASRFRSTTKVTVEVEGQEPYFFEVVIDK